MIGIWQRFQRNFELSGTSNYRVRINRVRPVIAICSEIVDRYARRELDLWSTISLKMEINQYLMDALSLVD